MEILDNTKSSMQTIETFTVNARFIDDRPLSDAFDSGFSVHERIAEEIAEEIQTSDASNIAIVGEWGSGKSTVLNMIKDKLGKSSLLFTFDAWSHAGDSLRKNFILALGNTLSEDTRYADSLNWEKEKKRLIGSETVETQLSQQEFSLFTTWLILTAAIFVVTQAAQKAFSPNLEDPLLLAVPWILTFFLPLVPVVFLAIMRSKSSGERQLAKILSWLKSRGTVLRSKFNGERQSSSEQKNKKGVCRRFEEKLKEAIAYFVGHPGGEITQTINRSPELDSIEFERIYHSLLKETTNKPCKLVIAIDTSNEILSAN